MTTTRRDRLTGFSGGKEARVEKRPGSEYLMGLLRHSLRLNADQVNPCGLLVGFLPLVLYLFLFRFSHAQEFAEIYAKAEEKAKELAAANATSSEEEQPHYRYSRNKK